MDRMRNKYLKLDAMSVTESIVALVIITISFSIGLNFYISIIASDGIVKDAKINMLLNEELEKTLIDKSYFEETKQYQGISIIKSIIPYQLFRNIYNLRITASKRGEKIAEINQLIYLND